MTRPIRSAAVFCGSRPGKDPAHLEAAHALGRGMAEAGLTLIYGGGGLGLMGAVAESALHAGGRVRGIIPEFLTRIERPSPGLTELEVTTSMHSRKTRMFELSDAAIVLSGGLGTLDETMEFLTWRQLGLHRKPVVIMDIAGWARPLLALIDDYIEAGFVPAGNRDFYTVAASAEEAIAQLLATPAPLVAAEAPASKL